MFTCQRFQLSQELTVNLIEAENINRNRFNFLKTYHKVNMDYFSKYEFNVIGATRNTPLPFVSSKNIGALKFRDIRRAMHVGKFYQ